MTDMKNIRLTKKLKTAILDHAKQEYEAGMSLNGSPKESCGVVVDNQYIPCTNLSEEEDQFSIDPIDLVRAEAVGEIQAYVHSHPDGTTEASEPDRVGINHHGKTWLICSYPEEDIALYNPDGYVLPLLGRNYFHSIQDCYTIVKDYYARELNITLNDYERKDLWWEDEANESLYYNNFKNEGFVEVHDSPKKHDVILFTLGKTFHVNHAGIYLEDGKLTSEEAPEVIGNTLFLHHPFKRLARREIYGSYWSDRTSFVLRHKSLLGEALDD